MNKKVQRLQQRWCLTVVSWSRLTHFRAKSCVWGVAPALKSVHSGCCFINKALSFIKHRTDEDVLPSAGQDRYCRCYQLQTGRIWTHKNKTLHPHPVCQLNLLEWDTFELLRCVEIFGFDLGETLVVDFVLCGCFPQLIVNFSNMTYVIHVIFSPLSQQQRFITNLSSYRSLCKQKCSSNICTCSVFDTF